MAQAEDGGSSVRDLVDRLESHLHADEREFLQSLQITPEKTDDELDALFLEDTFDRCKLLKLLSVTKLDSKSKTQQSNEDL